MEEITAWALDNMSPGEFAFTDYPFMNYSSAWGIHVAQYSTIKEVALKWQKEFQYFPLRYILKDKYLDEFLNTNWRYYLLCNRTLMDYGSSFKEKFNNANPMLSFSGLCKEVKRFRSGETHLGILGFTEVIVYERIQ